MSSSTPASSTVAPATAVARPPAATARLQETPLSVLHSRIAYVQTADRAGGQYDLFLMDIDGHTRQQLTHLPGIATSPSWSPDGRSLAFVSTQDSTNPTDCASGYVELRCNFEIYRVQADGTGVTRLTNTPNYDRDPAWSPDGTQIVFSSRVTGAPDGYLYVIDAQGGPMRQLTTGAVADAAPSWSPDGQHIAFMRSTDQETQIYIMRADGSAITQLSTHGSVNARPAWSPDGTQIAYVRVDQNGQGTLMVMAPDGSQAHAIMTALPVAGGYTPAWAPDGRALLFEGQETGYFNIYRVNLDGTLTERLTDYTAFFTAPAWSPEQQ